MNPALVSLVGAGPGHPGLLTVRAAQCLREADLVLYDKLVPIDLLDEYIRADAERVCVSDLGKCHGQQVTVYEKMIETARLGKRIARLKGGDPSLFGRVAEEANALRQAGIPYEIVPGVTAALGAAAFAGIPLTHRSHASAVAIVTGHETPDKPETMLNWPLLARFPGTLVIYMGMSRLAVIVQQLIANGRDATTPAAAVQWASTGDQQTVDATLVELPARVKAAGMSAPALIFIGPVVALRQHLAWFEHLPLFGQRILVTRPRHQAGDLVRRLIDLGAVPLVLPAVAILPPADWSDVDQALAHVESYQWLVFTSANGVHALLGRLRHLGRDLRALGPVRLAAIGPKTAEALRQYHLEPDLVPARFQSEDLAAALKEKIQPGQRVLLARADRGREVLREELARICEVAQVAVYTQVDAIDPTSRVLDNLRRGEIDYITLTSSNIARSLIEQLDVPCRARLESGAVGLVSISPVTSNDIRRLGMPVAAEATEATAEGVVEALIKLVRSKRELLGEPAASATGVHSQ